MGHATELFKGIGRDDIGAKKWGKEYGSIYGIYFMNKPALVVNDPEVASRVVNHRLDGPFFANSSPFFLKVQSLILNELIINFKFSVKHLCNYL